MPIYFRYFIIIITAKSIIPQSVSARITDSYSDHQAQIENRNELTDPEDYVQLDDEPMNFEEEYFDNVHDENIEHLYYSSQRTSSSNEELDHQGGEKNHHISSSNHANENSQQNNDFSEHVYHSSQTVSSSNQELDYHQQGERETQHISTSSHTYEDSHPDNDLTEHFYHSSQTVSTSNQQDGSDTHLPISSYENEDLQPDNDVSELIYNSSQTGSSSNQELNHPKNEKESYHISYSHHANDDSESNNNNLGQSETYINDVEFDNEYTDYLAHSETSKNEDPPIISDDMQLKHTNNLDERIDNLKDYIAMQINNQTNYLIARIDNIIDLKTRCSLENGFMPPAQDQCFVFFDQPHRNWEDADSKCKIEGLQLAKPKHNNVLWLRRIVVDNHGSYTSWIGGRGDGSYFRWVRGQEIIWGTSSFWHPSYPGSLNTNHCLGLLTRRNYINGQPNKPYSSESCSNLKRTICELI